MMGINMKAIMNNREVLWQIKKDIGVMYSQLEKAKSPSLWNAWYGLNQPSYTAKPVQSREGSPLKLVDQTKLVAMGADINFELSASLQEKLTVVSLDSFQINKSELLGKEHHYLERNRFYDKGGIKLLYNSDTGEILDSSIDFFSDDFKLSTYYQTFTSEGGRSTVNMLTDRYGQMLDKIDDIDFLKDEQKELLRDHLKNDFENAVDLHGFSDYDYYMTGVVFGKTGNFTVNGKRDFAEQFVEAYDKSRDRIWSIQQAFRYINDKYGLVFSYFSTFA